MEIPYQRFGSATSEDMDVVFFVETLGSIAENANTAKMYAARLAQEKGSGNINPNLAMVADGQLQAVFKGTVDELNNALYHTYALHAQEHPLLISRLLPRDVELKIIRCTRTILSHFTRTEWRASVKNALAGDIADKIACLRALSPELYGKEVNGVSDVQFFKTAAFQLGQTLALMDGEECYTKESIASRFPELMPYLQRRPVADLAPLRQFWEVFIERVSLMEPDMNRRKE